MPAFILQSDEKNFKYNSDLLRYIDISATLISKESDTLTNKNFEIE